MIGQDIHVFPDIKNQYISETSEKTKLIRFDKQGFNMYLKGFLEAKYQKIITFINTVGTLKRTRSNFSAFMNLVMMFNSRKVAGNTTLVRQGELCNYLFFVNNGHFMLLRSIDFIDSLNCRMEELVPRNAADPNQALIELEKTLPFEDPKKYSCTFTTKLMQIAQLKKGKSFGDTNLLNEWPSGKMQEDFVSQQTEPYTVLAPDSGEVYYIQRHIFLECVGEQDAEDFVRSRPLIPDDRVLRQKFY